MLQKNQVLDLSCDALGAEFEGIGHIDGQVVFARGVLPGERARVKIIKVSKRYAVARVEQVLSFSARRVTPPCPYFGPCGGCVAQHVDYAQTLLHKRRQVADCLARIGGIESARVLDTVGMETPWRYRNKGAFPAGGTPTAPAIGIYAARSHRIVDAPRGCLLQTEQSDAIISAAREWMRAHHIAPYQEETHTGLLRHLITREAKDGTAMLVLAINGRDIPFSDALISAVTRAAPRLRSIVLAENTQRTNVVLSDRFRTLWGEDTLTDEIAGFSLRVSPRSFFQVNRAQAERLYAAAIEMAKLTGNETVWDLYCGAGSITLPLARYAGHVIGVEIVGDAIADARVNAKAAGVENVTFHAGATEDVAPALLKAHGAPDVVVLDPPRKGCDAAVLHTIARAAPKRVVYVSCNPATLARDIKCLCENGYTMEMAQPVDMFAWTGHVECVALLERKPTEGHACAE